MKPKSPFSLQYNCLDDKRLTYDDLCGIASVSVQADKFAHYSLHLVDNYGHSCVIHEGMPEGVLERARLIAAWVNVSLTEPLTEGCAA